MIYFKVFDNATPMLMTETHLNIHDKSKLKADIKISLVIGFLFSILIIVLVGLIPAISFLFNKETSEGFLTRGLFISGLLFLPFVVVSWTNILKYIDLRKGLKLIIQTDDYKVVKKKGSAFILIGGDTKQKIKIDTGLAAYINISQPLTIEISKLGKSLLFISNNNDKDNLLDKLYNDDNQ